MKLSVSFLLVVAGLPIHYGWASATRSIDADALQSSNHANTLTLPATTDTLVGKNTTDTLTNKSLSGATNTLTAVPAATALSGQVPVANGGTGASTATTGFNALSPLTTKGDVVSHDGTNNLRVAVGSNTQVLTADSTQAAGVKWATPGAATWAFPVKWRIGVSLPSPIEVIEFDQNTFQYQAGGGQALYASVKVPATYTAGKQIFIEQGFYSPSTTNNFQFSTVASLIRVGTDAAGSVTNQRTSTPTALTNSVTNQLRALTFDLTDATGLINAVAVSAGDEIEIKLTRSAVDTDTADVRLRSDAGIVRAVP